MSVNTCDVPVPTIPVECKDLPPQRRYIRMRSPFVHPYWYRDLVKCWNQYKKLIMEKIKQNKALKVQENKGVPEDKLKIARSQRVVKKRS